MGRGKFQLQSAVSGGGDLGYGVPLHDTCGVHNLQGIPGIIAAVIGIIAAAAATEDLYGDG